MKKPTTYLQSIALISCREPFTDEWFDRSTDASVGFVKAIEVNAKDYIPAMEARRMTKILKRAICSSRRAIADAGNPEIDAIITSTAMGCMETSEKFLMDIVNGGEELLKPTLFMQSTHNTISSMIAIHLKNHGYNMTFSHGKMSFESALLDADMQIALGAAHNVLLGQHDEMTDLGAKLITDADGSFHSEASVAMVVSDSADNAICAIGSPCINDDINAYVGDAKIDAIVADDSCADIIGALTVKAPVFNHTKVFGNTLSNSAVALYAGSRLIAKNRFPSYHSPAESGINNVLCINREGNDYCATLLTRV